MITYHGRHRLEDRSYGEQASWRAWFGVQRFARGVDRYTQSRDVLPGPPAHRAYPRGE